MKKLRKYLCAVAVVVAAMLSFTSLAQFGGGGGPGRGDMPPNMEGRATPEPPDPEKMVEQEVKWMKKKLKLKPDQTERVTDISTKYAFAQVDLLDKSIKKGTRPTEKDMKQIREKMDALMVQKDKEMSLVLAPKQFEKYLKKREDLAKSVEKSNGRTNDGPPAGGSQGGGGRTPF